MPPAPVNDSAQPGSKIPTTAASSELQSAATADSLRTRSFATRQTMVQERPPTTSQALADILTTWT